MQSPIIGADFLRHHNLLVDLKHKWLIDSMTSVISLELPWALVVKPGHGRRDNFSSGLLVEFVIE
jgi:hypothetical protein